MNIIQVAHTLTLVTTPFTVIVLLEPTIMETNPSSDLKHFSNNSKLFLIYVQPG